MRLLAVIKEPANIARYLGGGVPRFSWPRGQSRYVTGHVLLVDGGWMGRWAT
jgi:hypothetical protein